MSVNVIQFNIPHLKSGNTSNPNITAIEKNLK